MYQNETYLVQTGYTYTFNGTNEPGTLSAIGIRNVDLDYDSNSTYIAGDVVFYNHVYYQALSATIQNVLPDMTSVDSGTWYELSETWLSYNHYDIGAKVLYNGQYYIALAMSHNANPETNPSIWELQII